MSTEQRNIYLSTIPPKEAVALVISAIDKQTLVQTETVPVHLALDRVTAKAIYARCSSPTFHASAMDGIAVFAEDTFTATEMDPLILTADKFHWVNTGNVLPAGCNAVIMIEHVNKIDEETVSIDDPIFPWNHVRKIGEDIVATELLLPQNHLLKPYDIGALLSAGIYHIEVFEKIRVHFMPTGDEVLDFLEEPSPEPGEVIDANSQICASYVQTYGATATWQKPVKDNKKLLEENLEKAINSTAHIIIVGAGSSAGSKDFTKSIFEAKATLLCHGIQIMPGKPTLIAHVNNKILIGAPGYPVSAIVCFEEILRPIIDWLSSKSSLEKVEIPVILSKKTPSKLGLTEVLRLAIGKVNNKYVATPLARGAGMITTLTKAQGIAHIPTNCEGIALHEEITARLLVPKKDLDNVLIHIGSHDNSLDILANELMGQNIPLQLISQHVGSMSGLAALKNSAALFAGAHLFDAKTQDFNFPFIEQYLPNRKIRVFNLVIREQGLIVQKNNPKNILSFQDLTREDVRFLNRQQGSGTRILLDDKLKKENINPADISGYEQEEFTHMAVAVNVCTNTVDCALGIYTAANALELDFIPLAQERYDLLIPEEHMQDNRIIALLKTIQSDTFKALIEEQSGYSTSLTGQEMTSGQKLT